jgi:hypothetical protein
MPTRGTRPRRTATTPPLRGTPPRRGGEWLVPTAVLPSFPRRGGAQRRGGCPTGPLRCSPQASVPGRHHPAPARRGPPPRPCGASLPGEAHHPTPAGQSCPERPTTPPLRGTPPRRGGESLGAHRRGGCPTGPFSFLARTAATGKKKARPAIPRLEAPAGAVRLVVVVSTGAVTGPRHPTGKAGSRRAARSGPCTVAVSPTGHRHVAVYTAPVSGPSGEQTDCFPAKGRSRAGPKARPWPVAARPRVETVPLTLRAPATRYAPTGPADCEGAKKRARPSGTRPQRCQNRGRHAPG